MKVHTMIAAVASVVAPALALLVLMGCTGAKCPEPTRSRCAGQVAQVCSAEERWEDVMDCDRIASLAGSGEPWVCCAVEGTVGVETYGCVPASRCAGGAR